MNKENLTAYEVVTEENLTDIHSTGWLLRHKKTGARVMLIENDDENKVFNIAFRTPPKDSTGVAHILEHSVLCGSREFPLKDPFVELVKGSLNTFLNAMTYPDKTCYPVASCNDKDFQNLMHVYLDAVFYPNIYKREEIFRQEGWNYHLEQKEGPLKYNGVVYNEMKGAFSSPDEVLEREIMNHLFPDTTYGCESGGDPKNIPDLTYENFLNFHRTYYHPSNSYIYLYGNMDMEEKLAFLDEHYLSHFDYLDVDSVIQEQKEFGACRDVTLEYPVAENEGEEDNTYLSYNMVVGNAADSQMAMAFEVLDYALLSAPGAPLKQALLDVKAGKDVYGSYDDGILQPYFTVIAKGSNPDRKEEFVSVIRQVLGDIVKNGIDKKAVEAGINYFEFRYREADFSSYPKGLMYSLDILGDWLYESKAPFAQVQMLKVFENLKKAGITRTVMLTGDGKKVAESVAADLGIGEVHSELLPADKVSKVEELLSNKSEKEKLAFVGDGINDAPVLSRADIGIAMGALGSDAAIEAADVVLMDDDPLKIGKAIRIAKKCMRIVYENIYFAIGVKLICLVLGAFGIANMWIAIFADVGVMVLAVLNAIRTLFVKNL